MMTPAEYDAKIAAHREGCEACRMAGGEGLGGCRDYDGLVADWYAALTPAEREELGQELREALARDEDERAQDRIQDTICDEQRS